MSEVWVVIRTFEDGSEMFSPICDSEATAQAWIRQNSRTWRDSSIAMCVRRITITTMADVSRQG